MKKLLVSMVLGLAMAGCGLESVANDIGNAIEEANFQAKADKVFAQAVSDVTGKVFDQAFAEEETAAAPKYVVKAEMGDEQTIEETVEFEDGGSATIKGTITATGTETEQVVTMKVDVVWTDLVSKIEGENGEEEVKTSGTMNIDGAITVAMSGEEMSIDVKFTQTGTITIDGRDMEFNIVTTYDGGDTISVVGTIDGRPYSKDIFIGAPDEGEEEEEVPAPVLSCLLDTSGDDCVDYYGANFSAASCDMGYTASATACIDMTDKAWAGSCVTDMGTADEKEHFYNTDQSAGCTGTWIAAQ